MTSDAQPSTPEISVILPCYNEVGNVAPLIEQVKAALALTGRAYEILCVDDHSTDGTYDALQSLATTNPELRVLRHKRNFGQSAGILSGYQRARGKYCVTLDSDLQNDPADIPAMLTMLEAERLDLVTGVRRRRNDSTMKRLSSRVANAVRGALLGDGIHDAGCSMRVVRRDALGQLIGFRALHRFLPTILKVHGYKVAEMTVNHRPRASGASKYGTLDRLFVGIHDIWGMRWYRKRHFPPDRLAD